MYFPKIDLVDSIGLQTTFPYFSWKELWDYEERKVLAEGIG
jgi:hypothetical protein